MVTLNTNLVDCINRTVALTGGAIIHQVGENIIVGEAKFQTTIPPEIENEIQHCLTYGCPPTSELQKDIPESLQKILDQLQNIWKDPMFLYWQESESGNN